MELIFHSNKYFQGFDHKINKKLIFISTEFSKFEKQRIIYLLNSISVHNYYSLGYDYYDELKH